MKSYAHENSATLWIVYVLGMLLAPAAHAHVGVGETSGFAHGLLHPLTGLDHIAAMVAVGLWAAQLGDRRVWVVPLTFVAVMSVGSLIGALGGSIPFVEPGIAASVFVLGVLIAVAVRSPLILSSALVGLFAVFHGHAHGAEMPDTASGLVYGFGFILATGLLHCCGISLGLLARKLGNPLLIRYAGGAIAALGIYLVVA